MDFNEGSYRTEFNYPSSSDSHFLEGLMPKKGIEAIQFLEEHPEYDGRGITVAIFGEIRCTSLNFRCKLLASDMTVSCIFYQVDLDS